MGELNCARAGGIWVIVAVGVLDGIEVMLGEGVGVEVGLSVALLVGVTGSGCWVFTRLAGDMAAGMEVVCGTQAAVADANSMASRTKPIGRRYQCAIFFSRMGI